MALVKPAVVNSTMAVKEIAGRVVFLRKVVPGGADRSYGIHVAELAGLPAEVTARAREVLANLEKQELDVQGAPVLARTGGGERRQRPVPALLGRGGARAREAAGARHRPDDADRRPFAPRHAPGASEAIVSSRLFGVGVEGPSLTPREREILGTYPPYGVILFRRNIENAPQLENLIAEVRGLGARFLFLDQEGGPVDRLRDLLAPLPSLRRGAGTEGAARRAGELAGKALSASRIRCGPRARRRPGPAGCRRSRPRRALRLGRAGADHRGGRRLSRRPAHRRGSADASSTSRGSAARGSIPTRRFRSWRPIRISTPWT